MKKLGSRQRKKTVEKIMSPEEMTNRANQIIASTKQIVKKHNLPGVEMTDDRRKDVDERVAKLQKRIETLSQELQ